MIETRILFLIIIALLSTWTLNAQGEHLTGNGTLRFLRNNKTSLSYSSGIVQVYINGSWGGICTSNDFGQREAVVICHQFGYSDAITFSTAGEESYGSVNEITITNVQCTNDEYQVMLQCDYRSSDECDLNDALTVDCMSTRVWDEPFSGQVRLQGGKWSSEGLVEIYCNNKWGTVCDNLFTQDSADTVCNQLGYTNAIEFDALDIQGNNSQPIWLTDTDCGSLYSCFTTCKNCPSSDEEVTECSHQEDATVQCTYNSTSSNSGGTLTRCDFPDTADVNIGLIVGTAIGVPVGCIIICIIICICCIICCYIK